jgi:hypothetical protein
MTTTTSKCQQQEQELERSLQMLLGLIHLLVQSQAKNNSLYVDLTRRKQEFRNTEHNMPMSTWIFRLTSI